MIRFFKSMTIVAGTVFITAPAFASKTDSWTDRIAKASRSAENHVNRGIRVASLGPVDLGSVELPAQARNKFPTSSEVRTEAPKVRLASLRTSKSDASDKPRRSLSGGSVNWSADAGCLDSTLRGIIRKLASNYGPLTVNSTCRSRSRNASVGGAPKSYHLKGEAVDFRVQSNVSAAYASLRDNGNVGGLKHYGGGLFHIDTGPRRSW
jgi:hypothetical protein